MKILVIQSAKGYLTNPENTRELMGLALNDRMFKEVDLTFVRLPTNLYETWYDIYDGATGFKWTEEARNGKLQALMDNVDVILVPSINRPVYDDPVLVSALKMTKTPFYEYRSKSTGFVKMVI